MWSLKRRNKLVEKWNKWKQWKKFDDFMELLPVHYAQCGKTSNSLPLTFFPSNQFIVKFFSKTLIWRNFCGKTRNSLPCKFFSSNQFIVKFLSKTLIWRNFGEKTVAVKFRNFHSVLYLQCLTSSRANFTKEKFI